MIQNGYRLEDNNGKGNLIIQDPQGTWYTKGDVMKHVNEVVKPAYDKEYGEKNDGMDADAAPPTGTDTSESAGKGTSEMEVTPGGDSVLMARAAGGGNNHFKTSTNQAPHYAQPGEPGKEEWKILELS